MSEIVLSVAQYAASTDLGKNLGMATDLIAKAGRTADLVILPENAMYSDPKKENAGKNYSEPLDGAFITAIKTAAKAAGTDVVAGFTETSDSDRPFNTLVHISAQGELDGVYRKIHLYDAFGYRESDSVTAGIASDPLVFDLNGVKVGAATCYDIRFPEMSRWLVDHGADVIVLPAAWAVGPMKEFHWETLIRARAIENTAYFAACGQTGPHCTGQSMIVDPLGVTNASAGEQSGAIATAIISTDRVAEIRASNPCLENRRFTVAPKL